MYIIEDELHAEHLGQFLTMKLALTEILSLSRIPWDQEPNQAPCMSWKTCGREYVIIEFDDSTTPWVEVRRIKALSISSAGLDIHIPLSGGNQSFLSEDTAEFH